MSEEEAPAAATPEPRPDVVQELARDAALATVGRWLAGLLGLAASGAGAAAVFMKDAHEAPATALLGLGAFFAYVGLSGQRLTRLKIGENEANLTRVLVDTLRDPKVPDEVKAGIATKVEERGAVLPPPVERVLERYSDVSELAASVHSMIAKELHRLSQSDAVHPFIWKHESPEDWRIRFQSLGEAVLRAEVYVGRRHVLFSLRTGDWVDTTLVVDPFSYGRTRAVLEMMLHNATEALKDGSENP